MAYTEADRKNVLEEANKKENEFRTMNMAFAYNLYDIMRLQLEELHRMANAMESINSILLERQSQ